jgi:4-carboxymuconolactone decarboxylase
MRVEQRKKRGAALIKQMMGSEVADATRSAWREISPDFEEYVVEFLAGEIWSRSNLDLKTRSLVTIATLAALGRSRALELNIRMAKNNGATRNEIVETLLQVAPYAGFPVAWDSLAVLDQVCCESEAETGG